MEGIVSWFSAAKTENDELIRRKEIGLTIFKGVLEPLHDFLEVL